MFNRLLAFFFPDRCVLCDTIIGYKKDRFLICEDCLAKLSSLNIKNPCKICGRPLEDERDFCNACLTSPRAFDRGFSCLLYKDDVRQSVIRFKFHDRLDYLSTYNRLLLETIRPEHEKEPFDCVLCVPMTKNALKVRGYNQSEYLAKDVAKELKLPCYSKALLKVKETPKQRTLSFKERLQNLKDAFSLAFPKGTFKNKRILLVDDVLTTGSTADAIAKVLKKDKPKTVYVLTLASVPFKKDVIDTEKDEDLLY